MDIHEWLKRKYGEQYPRACIVLYDDGSGQILESLTSLIRANSMNDVVLFRFSCFHELRNHLEGNEE